MGSLLVVNATRIRLSFWIYILLIRIKILKILCNMLFCMTQNFHTCVIKNLKKYVDLYLTLKILLRIWVKRIPLEKRIRQYYPIYTLHFRYATEKLLCNQILGHYFDQYLYNAHKYIDGVPNLRYTTSKVLEQCPT